jgi:hypothetical protein
MFTNTLTLKGKIRVILSQFKTVLLNFINVKKKLYLYKAWSNINFPRKDSVIIIADGPSFNSDIAENIMLKRKHFDIITMNHYCLNDISKKLVPDYYLLSDPENVKTENVLSRKINESLKKYILNDCIKFISPYGKRWEIYKKPFLQFNDSENLSSNNIDPRHPRGYRSNTGFKAIALMLALQYSKIFIVGFDYDYPRKIVLDKNNKLFLLDEHSYGSDKLDCSNYFDSVAHAMHWWATDYWHFKKLNSPKVTNVTKTSMIDVFSRMTVEDFNNYIRNIS